jgi:hypothetical protein
MAERHYRLPEILDEQDWPIWLGEVEGYSTALLELRRKSH